MVKALHAAGIEVILDVVYNHTAEGGPLGPTLSFRGLDDRGLLQARRPATDGDDATGTSPAAATPSTPTNPRALRLILDSLRYWVTEMHVDGFRFDLPSALARTGHDVDMHCRVPHRDRPGPGAAAREADRRAVGRVDGRLPGRLVPAAVGGVERPVPRHDPRLLAATPAAIRDRRLPARRLVRPVRRRRPLAVRLGQLRHRARRLHACATWSPTTHKHNEANGEHNRDGTDNNRSWNHGVEGETDDADDRRAAAPAGRQPDGHAVPVAPASPMITAGDERGRTQRGNNNAYCQDNEISWVDWRPDDAWLDVYEVTKTALRLRREHPALRQRHYFEGTPDRSTAARRTSPGSTPSGREMDRARLVRRRGCTSIGMFVSGDPLRSPGPHGEQQLDTSFLLWLNAGDDAVEVTLPENDWVQTRRGRALHRRADGTRIGDARCTPAGDASLRQFDAARRDRASRQLDRVGRRPVAAPTAAHAGRRRAPSSASEASRSLRGRRAPCSRTAPEWSRVTSPSKRCRPPS